MIRRNPQAVAWLVVLTGLVSFCLIWSIVGYGVYYFLFQSPIPLTTRLVVSKGSVKLKTLDNSDPLVDNQQTIDPQTYVDVSEDSQAVLYFQDPYSKKVITTVTLTSETKLLVIDATRPRFDFSRRPYLISMSRATGQLIITAAPDGRDYQMDIRADLGTARLLDDGRYTISTEYYPETGLERINLFNQGGRARLFKPSMNEWRDVNPNRIAHIAQGEFEAESDSPYKILAEGRFTTDQPPQAQDEMPLGWACQSISEQNEPQGIFFRDSQADYALRFQRLGPNRIKHAETACLLQTNGIDTAPYSSFRIQVRLNLRGHSVPLCGVVGSECPIMIEIAYQVPDAGDSSPPVRKWHHGFYLTPDPSKPKSCDTCRLAHERINQNVWYFYDSGDLRPQFVDPNSPAPVIRWISVYASGHEYDALVNDVTLLGTPQ